MDILRKTGAVRTGWVAALVAVLVVGCGGGADDGDDAARASDANAPSEMKGAGTKGTSPSKTRIPAVKTVTPTQAQLDKALFVAVQDPGIQENVNLFLFGADGKALAPLTEDGMIKYDLALSPTGNRIAFMVRPPKVRPIRKDVMVMDLQTGKAINLTEDFPPQAEIAASRDAGAGANVYMNGAPSFTPDGERIVFACNPLNDACHLYAAAADGSGLERLTLEPEERSRGVRYMEPECSPVAEKVVFTRIPQGNTKIRDLWVFDIQTRTETKITEASELEYRLPTWSPDGSQIAFVTRAEKARHWNIWVIDADGNNQRKLNDEPLPGDEMSISWLPSGDRVAFVYREGLEDVAENNEIYTIGLEGGDPIKVSKTPMFESNPVFLQ